jgi:hypothetical protein
MEAAWSDFTDSFIEILAVEITLTGFPLTKRLS